VLSLLFVSLSEDHYLYSAFLESFMAVNLTNIHYINIRYNSIVKEIMLLEEKPPD